MTKTYSDQIHEHLQHLQAQGLDVSELKIIPPGSQWTRCHAIGESGGRGEYAYISNSEKLNNGLLGIKTAFRGPKGGGSFRTYGLWPDGSEGSINLSAPPNEKQDKATNERHKQVAKKASVFWHYSALSGSSDYLERKKVGFYGIRFRSNEKYGRVAVVPMLDEGGKFWSYQLLNADGKKRFPKDSRTEGLFHKLKKPVNGEPIGIAESYATAATCLELIKFPTVCAFSSENLEAVTKTMLSLFPASLIILFADNDRHLVAQGKPNKGLLKAQEAKNLDQTRIVLAVPDFGCLELNKEASDWNDLVRLKGNSFAKAQMLDIMRQWQ